MALQGDQQPQAAGAARCAGDVFLYVRPGDTLASAHEQVSLTNLAQRIARLMGGAFAGPLAAGEAISPGALIVPNVTLTTEEASALGALPETRLFGGVVPYPFVATKAISHPLVARGAAAPEGWSPDFCEAVKAVVLDGYSAFSPLDALAAAERLLANGPVRLKPPNATAGRGQSVARTIEAVTAAVAQIHRDKLARDGLVLEEQLDPSETFSVGQARLAGMTISYHGVQRATLDRKTEEVYGGSSILATRGGFEDLLAFGLDPAAACDVRQALVYDAAAFRHFPGLTATRRNYDVIRGMDGRGRTRRGVLEQSWRVGGASAAEIAALEAFAADPELIAVRAACFEVHGDLDAAPPGAVITCRCDDPAAGPMLKYTVVEPVDA